MRCRLLLPLVFLALAGADDCQDPRPDLVATAFTVDADGYLRVEVTNLGFADVTTTGGSIDIMVDGHLAGSRTFASLAADERGFLLADGRGVIRTNVRLGGRRREVSVVVDPAGEIGEEGETNNVSSRVVDAPALAGVDYVVTDLSVVSGQLGLLVYNGGTVASPAGRVVGTTVNVDGVNRSQDVTLPAIAAATSYRITVPSPVALTGPRRVIGRIYTYAPSHEIDATNNLRIEHLPDAADLSAFDALLADPAIAGALVWQDATGTFTFPAWTPTMQANLRGAITSLLEARAYELPNPPALDADQSMSVTTARRIYLAHVAQSLWLEGTGRVSWSMRTLTAEGRAILLDSRELLTFVPATGRYRFSSTAAANPTPFRVYEFLQSNGLMRPTQLETVEALLEWTRNHMRHGSSGDGTNLEQYGWDGPAFVERILWPLPGKDHVSGDGCWTATEFLRTTLRVLNIPVARRLTLLAGLHHSSPEFVSIGRRMPHGDDPYNAQQRPSGGVFPMPARDLLYTSGQFNSLFVAPTTFDCTGSTCNSVSQQISANHARELLRDVHAYRLDYLVDVWARDGRAGADEVLATQDNCCQTFAAPVFSTAQRTTMLDDLQAYITDTLGGGDLARGLQRGQVRYQRNAGVRRVR